MIVHVVARMIVKKIKIKICALLRYHSKIISNIYTVS